MQCFYVSGDINESDSVFYKIQPSILPPSEVPLSLPLRYVLVAFTAGIVGHFLPLRHCRHMEVAQHFLFFLTFSLDLELFRSALGFNIVEI